jgi:hypothetical protein
MTSELSSKNRQSLTDEAARAEKKSHGKAKRGFWAAAAGIALAVAASVVPFASLPVTILFVAGSITGILAGSYAAGQYLNERNMRKARDDINGDKPLEKLAARSSRFKKIFKLADHAQGLLAIGALGGLAVALLVPVAAPVAWPLYYALFTGYVGAQLAQNIVRPVNDDMSYLSRSAEYSADSDRLTALAADKAPAAQVLALSPAPAFENAANGNTPPATAPNAAPEKKLAPPKP